MGDGEGTPRTFLRMTGTMVEADFEKNMITFEMEGDYVAAAGKYSIIEAAALPTKPPQPADGGDRVATLIELLTKYQAEYDTPCPDLTLRHRYRADVFAALAKFQPAGGES